MKFVALSALLLASLCGQTPLSPGTPAPPKPAATAEISPDTVVAEIAGKKYTKAEMDKFIDTLPPQYKPAVRANPQALTTFFVMKRLSEEAEKAGRDKDEPFKSAIEWNRAQILMQAQVTWINNSAPLDRATLEKYYHDNPDRFKQAKVRVIQVMFNPTAGATTPDGKKAMTEAEAKTKIDELRKKAVGGADFAQLAIENSEDKASAVKGGDFGFIKRNSPYPDPVKKAVFALKAGEISEPVKMPTSFYLIKADEVSVQPYDDVSTEITQAVRADLVNKYMQGIQDQYKVKVDNPAYFGSAGAPPGPAQLQQVHP